MLPEFITVNFYTQPNEILGALIQNPLDPHRADKTLCHITPSLKEILIHARGLNPHRYPLTQIIPQHKSVVFLNIPKSLQGDFYYWFPQNLGFFWPKNQIKKNKWWKKVLPNLFDLVSFFSQSPYVYYYI